MASTTMHSKKMKIDASGASAMQLFEEQEENTECVLGAQQTKCNFHSKRNGYNNNVIVASIMAVFVMMMHHAVEASPSKDVQPSVKINKCCEKFEIYVDSRCTSAKEVNTSEYRALLKINQNHGKPEPSGKVISERVETHFEAIHMLDVSFFL